MSSSDRGCAWLRRSLYLVAEFAVVVAALDLSLDWPVISFALWTLLIIIAPVIVGAALVVLSSIVALPLRWAIGNELEDKTDAVIESIGRVLPRAMRGEYVEWLRAEARSFDDVRPLRVRGKVLRDHRSQQRAFRRSLIVNAHAMIVESWRLTLIPRGRTG